MNSLEDIYEEYSALKESLETDKRLPKYVHELVKLIDLAIDYTEKSSDDITTDLDRQIDDLEGRLNSI